jgi:hypothetical protein
MEKQGIQIVKSRNFPDLTEGSDRMAGKNKYEAWQRNVKDQDPETMLTLQIKQNTAAFLTHLGYADGEVFKYGKISQLQQDLANRQGISYDTQSISDLIKNDRPALNVCLVMGLCELFGVKTAAVFSRHPIDLKEAFYLGQKEELYPVAVFEDQHYWGTYQGFSYSSNTLSKSIEQFTLTISKEDDHVSAQYVYTDKNSTRRIFRGVPKIMNQDKLIELRLLHENGSSISLFFGYHNYNTSNMYFRTGVIVTNATSSQDLLCKNFVLYRQVINGRQSDKNNLTPFLPGLLKMTNGRFTIRKAALIEEPELYASFSSAFVNKGDIVTVDEQTIMSCLKNYEETTQIKMIGSLLRLKRHAIEPNVLNHQTMSEEQVLLAHFIRSCLTEQETLPQWPTPSTEQ